MHKMQKQTGLIISLYRFFKFNQENKLSKKKSLEDMHLTRSFPFTVVFTVVNFLS